MAEPTAVIIGSPPIAQIIADRLRLGGLNVRVAAPADLDEDSGDVLLVVGADSIKEVSARVGKDVPIIGLAEGDEAQASLAAGANDVVSVDAQPALLNARVRALLVRRESDDLGRRVAATHDALLRVESSLAIDGEDPASLRSALLVAADVMGFERASLIASVAGSERAVVVAATDDPQHQQFALQLWNYPEIRRAVRHAQPIAIADATAHPSTASVAGKIKGANVRAIVVVPVMWNTVVIGAVVFRNSKPGVGHVTSELFGFAQLFSSRIAAHLRDTDIMQTLQEISADEQASASKEQRATLPRTREFLEKLIDSVVDGVVAADIDGTVVLFNAGAERIFGASAEEMIGRKSVADLFPGGVAESIMHMLRSPEHGGQGRLNETRREVLCASGELVPVNMTASILYEDGSEVATVGIFTDLRERIRIEQRLLSAQEKLEVTEKQALVAQLAGTAAHELNQPLTSIMGYAQLVARQLEDDGQSGRAVAIILREAERMAEIVRKIGRITSFETKDYVGGTSIIDLEKSSPPPAVLGGAVEPVIDSAGAKRSRDDIKQTAKIPWPIKAKKDDAK